MATQLVLSLEHILGDIFNNLAGTIPTSLDAFFDLHKKPPAKLCDDEWIDRKTLVSAALTCKAFSEPASRVIWSSLHRTGFAPLVQVYRRMRKNHHQRMRKSPPGGVHATTGLSQRQWGRLERIAARVCCVVYDMDRDQNILPALLTRYGQTERALFPNLRILAWRGPGNADDLDWLRVLAPPSAPISALYFRMEWPGTPEGTVEFRMLIDRYRHSLRKLGCHLNVHTDSLVPMLPLLRELRQIEIHNLNSSILAALPLLPKLETLMVRKINISTLLGSKAIVSHTLQQVHLTLVSPPQLPPLFDSLACPRLRTLSLDLWIDAEIDDAERQLRETFTHPLVRQLATLDLQLSLRPIANNPPFSQILTPLLSLPMHNFSMLSDTPVSVTSQDLELAARTWPLLSSFKLDHPDFKVRSLTMFLPTSRPPASLPSLSSVLKFVRACLALRVLEIQPIEDVSAEELATVEEMCRPSESEHPLQTSLEYLKFVGRDYDWLRQVAISDPARLACILRRSFPRLRELGPPETLEDSNRPWTDYRRLQDCFHKLLQQE